MSAFSQMMGQEEALSYEYRDRVPRPDGCDPVGSAMALLVTIEAAMAGAAGAEAGSEAR
jgi:hypothetical protein